MDKTLPEITRKLGELEATIQENLGEIDSETEKELELWTESLMHKVDSYYHVVEKFKGIEKHWNEKAKYYSNVAKGCRSVHERLKERLKFHMAEKKKTEVFGQDFKFRLSKSKDKLEIDEREIHAKWMKQVVKWEPDKEKIREALENNEKIDGAKLIKSYSLRSYANKE